MDTLLQVLEREPVPPRQLVPELPLDVDTIALKALQKEPSRRYDTANALALDLGRWLGGVPIHARPVGRARAHWRWCRRNPALAAASILAATSVVAALVVSMTLAVVQTRAANTERGLRGDLRKSLTAVEKERDNASAQRIKAQGLAADMALERGTALAAGRDSSGLLWIARALEISPSEQSQSLGRIIRVNLASWSQQVPVLRSLSAMTGK